MEGPNPITVGWSVAKVQWRVSAPLPNGTGVVDHALLDPILRQLSEGGMAQLSAVKSPLDGYIEAMTAVDPDGLTRDASLAYWLNLYNAGALALAARAAHEDVPTVLRVPGGFSRPFVSVQGESLSLDAIEHAKVRRFGDPRIHGALVCGSVSCPTLRGVPYTHVGLDDQLADQMQAFMAGGGAIRQENELYVSRVFRWYGGDFVRPHAMPVWIPGGTKRLRATLTQWLPADMQAWVGRDDPPIRFQPYDWGLRCAVK